MLEGLEVSVVNLSDVLIDKTFRIESEFFTSKNSEINKYYRGEEIIDFVQYGTSEELNEEKIGYPVLRLNEFDSYFIGNPSKHCNLIDKKKYGELVLKENDVLICRTNGNPKLVGKAAIVPQDYEYAYASYLFKIRPKKDLINSATLVVYLNSKYGRLEIEKYSMTSNQTNFSPAKFREIKIPILSKSFQKKIEKTVTQAHQKLTQSKSLYTQAEQILLEAVGLGAGSTPLQGTSNTNYNVKSFKESFAETGRLDAEYYQKKYEEIEAIIKKNGCFKISDVYDVLSNASPSEYEESGFKVIKTKQIRIPSAELDKIEAYTTNDSILVEKNDLLFASMGVGSLGRVSFIDSNIENYTTDGTIRIFRAKEVYKNKNLEIPTLLYLTSTFGQELIYKYVIGSTGIISISRENVENLLVPKVSEEVAEKLTKLVLDSQTLKTQSQQLLHLAKQAVEIAIEEGEDKGMEIL